MCFRGWFTLRNSAYRHCVTLVTALAIIFIAQSGPSVSITASKKDFFSTVSPPLLYKQILTIFERFFMSQHSSDSRSFISFWICDILLDLELLSKRSLNEVVNYSFAPTNTVSIFIPNVLLPFIADRLLVLFHVPLSIL